MQRDEAITIVGLGDNPTLIWGMRPAERLRRIAGENELPFSATPVAGPQLLVDLAYAFDPALLRYMARAGAGAVVQGGRAVMVRLDADRAGDAAAIARAMQAGAPMPPDIALPRIVHDGAFTLYNIQLRKREHPFVTILDPNTVRSIERASYYAAYKGVTDVLTRYLWPSWALVLTRLCARVGITPNMVTAVGAALCVWATILFWQGHFWIGMAAGLVFMVLDTVDGKLARCTITSSWWGNIFDHGIDLIHPPFWWYAWGVGLAHWGLALSDPVFAGVMIAILGGYVVQRLIEGIFLRRFGFHIHVWQKADSDFRLITARRNPNMVILFAATAMGRPDLGLIAVAVWTVVSLLFHQVRLMQAGAAVRRGEPIRSWLED